MSTTSFEDSEPSGNNQNAMSLLRECRVRRDRGEMRIELRDALRTLGVTQIKARYEGYADEGNVQEVGSDPANHLPSDIERMLKDFVWDVAHSAHPTFEDNEGAYGNFTWDLRTDVIDLEHNTAVIEYELDIGKDLDRTLVDTLEKDPEIMARDPNRLLKSFGIDPEKWSNDGILDERKALKDKLSSLGVSKIEAFYEGRGGSGNFRSIRMTPEPAITGQSDPYTEMNEPLRGLLWSIIQAEYPEFEDDAGGEGILTWTLDTDTIDLDHGDLHLENSRSEDVGREHLDERPAQPRTERDSASDPSP